MPDPVKRDEETEAGGGGGGGDRTVSKKNRQREAPESTTASSSVVAAADSASVSGDGGGSGATAEEEAKVTAPTPAAAPASSAEGDDAAPQNDAASAAAAVGATDDAAVEKGGDDDDAVALQGLEDLLAAHDNEGEAGDGGGETAAPVGESTRDASPSDAAADVQPVGVVGGGGRVSVTTERKEDLLLRARKSRNAWVGSVPLPYRQMASVSPSQGRRRGVVPDENDGTVNGDDERFASLRGIRAAKQLPSALSILSVLYGSAAATLEADLEPETAGDGVVENRIRSVLRSHMEEADERKVVPTPIEVVREELALKDCGDGNSKSDDRAYLKQYYKFWLQLQDPACAMLVQGMRNFCGRIRHVPDKKELSARLTSYVRGTARSMQSHAAWKRDGGGSGSDGTIGGSAEEYHEAIRRMLEAFIYGQCTPHIESVLFEDNSLARQREKDWIQRLNDLQFVTPHHLEISCLVDDDSDDVGYLRDLLKEPLEALRSVRLYFSPYDKLQRILALYHKTNAALSTALNRGKTDDSKKKLPSADDVLPTIILTVLLAKPEKLNLDLELVEDFSPQEYLRGEAGYAFTNLYGAVHFLQDLDLEHPASLHISADDFRKGLEECRSKAEQRIRSQSIVAFPGNFAAEDELDAVEDSIRIPPSAVRRARLQGEDLDVDWALQWKEQHNATNASALDGKNTATVNGCRHSGAATREELPQGFTRSYNFLTTRPEDVRMSDLPKLLAEYRSLVHTTEVLLAERAEKARAERKAKRLSAQTDLFRRVSKIDPSLLPNS